MLRCHRPAILKLNRHELADTFGLASADLATLAREAEALRQREGLEALVLTCGGEGILALTAGAAYLAVSPAQVEVNAAGAGDAVSAALPYRLACGDSWSEALRWAAATSAAVVLTPGTADCRPADIAAILPQTTVQRLA
jgi:fructose-1-phosphate kinase PfkB-like protein